MPFQGDILRSLIESGTKYRNVLLQYAADFDSNNPCVSSKALEMLRDTLSELQKLQQTAISPIVEIEVRQGSQSDKSAMEQWISRTSELLMHPLKDPILKPRVSETLVRGIIDWLRPPLRPTTLQSKYQQMSILQASNTYFKDLYRSRLGKRKEREWERQLDSISFYKSMRRTLDFVEPNQTGTNMEFVKDQLRSKNADSINTPPDWADLDPENIYEPGDLWWIPGPVGDDRRKRPRLDAPDAVPETANCELRPQEALGYAGSAPSNTKQVNDLPSPSTQTVEPIYAAGPGFWQTPTHLIPFRLFEPFEPDQDSGEDLIKRQSDADPFYMTRPAPPPATTLGDRQFADEHMHSWNLTCDYFAPRYG